MNFRNVTATLLAFATVPLVSAVTLDIKWLGASGNWSSTLNWPLGGLPGGNNHVQIDPLNAFNVTVNVDTVALTTALTIGTNDTVAINNAQSLTMDAQGASSSLILNAGSSLSLNSVGNTTSLLLANGTITASGTGTIDLGNNSANRIISGSGATTLINQTTIQGAGQISANTLIVHNQATISALYSTALIFDPSASADAINSGTLKAATGGLLQLINGVIDNTGGQILADTGGQVELSGITIKDGTLKTTGTGTIKVTGTTTLSEGVTIDSGSNVYLNNFSALNIADTLTVNGTLHLDSVGNSTNAITTSAITTFDGTGKLSLSNNFNNRIYGSASTNILVNKITFEGAGQIGVNSATVDNQGTISALYSTPLKIDPGAGGFTNTGTLNAATGGLLQLGNGTFTNTGGLIFAATGAEIELLSGATILGGTLTTSGTGFFESRTASTLNGVTLSSGSTFHIPNATNATLINAINNAGTISLQSLGNATDLIIDPLGATLTGGGVIEFSNHTNNRIYGASASSQLTNSNNTIRGAGQIGAGQLAFTNQGTVEANLNAATLTIDPAASAFVNTGTYRAVNGGVLVLNTGSFDNTGGTIQAQTSSTVRLSGGTTVTHGTIDVGPSAALQLATSSFDSGNLTTATGATINTTSGTNTLGGTLNLVPDASLTLNNNTNLTLLSSGSYTIDGTLTINSLGNTTDLIISGGDVTLGGSGKIVLNNNFNNRVYGTITSNMLILNGLDLEGGGQLGVNALGITNNGVITANATTALTIDPSTAGFTNTGTLKADGGTLALTSGVYTNTGGFIESTTGSTVQFNGSSFSGGTLKGSGSLTTVGSNVFNDISIDSGTTFTGTNNTNSTFTGTLTNAGQVTLHSLGNLTDFVAGAGGLNLIGNGSIELIGPNSRIYAVDGSTSLTNTSNKIHGYGQLGADQLVFTNHANVVADVNAQQLVVDTTGSLTNNGLFKSENGATLRLQDTTFENQTGGAFQSDLGSNIFFSDITLTDGHLTGAGAFRNIFSSTYHNLRLDSDTTLDIDNNTSATLTGTLNNPGQIHLNSLGNLTNLIAGSGGLTLSGGGEIHLSGHINNRIYGVTGPTTLTNADHTIRGYGQIGANQLNLINQATITADTAGNTLSIDTSDGLTNSGLIQAIDGGDLLFNGSAITNLPGGSIHSATGSSVRFATVTLSNGHLTGSGTIRNSVSSTFHGLSLAPGTTLGIDNATSATFSGTLNNAGTIQLNSVGNLTNFIAAPSGLSLTGNGTIQLSGHNNNRLYGQTGTTTITNDFGHTIAGSGQLGVNQLLLQNNGTIEADTSSTLTIDLTGPFTNHGNLKATGSGGISLSDPLVNQGTVKIASGSNLTIPADSFTQSAGKTEILGGTLTATALQIDSGDFDAHGTVNGTLALTNASLGLLGGRLTLDSSLTLDSATTVQIQIGGNDHTSNYGNLLGDTLALAGTLEVRFSNDFHLAIQNSDTFTLFTATNALTGTFTNLPANMRLFTSDGLGSFALSYHALSVGLTDFNPIPEPATWALFLAGFVLIGFSRRPR